MAEPSEPYNNQTPINLAVSFEELRAARIEYEAAHAGETAKIAEQIFERGALIRPSKEELRKYG
jgi:hypothetical protein